MKKNNNVTEDTKCFCCEGCVFLINSGDETDEWFCDESEAFCNELDCCPEGVF